MAAVIVSAVGYFFSIIAVFTTIMAFMMLLIGVLNPSTFEKVRHYPHPRPIIEQTVPPTNPATSTNIAAALPSGFSSLLSGTGLLNSLGDAARTATAAGSEATRATTSAARAV